MDIENSIKGAIYDCLNGILHLQYPRACYLIVSYHIHNSISYPYRPFHFVYKNFKTLRVPM